MAASRESVGYSIAGAQYNNTYDRWEWTDGDGNPHREGDYPAFIYPAYGTFIFCLHGKYEKLVAPNGLEYNLEGGKCEGCRWTWYDENGDFHRDGDNPAVIWCEGSAAWFYHGERHRLTGPAYVPFSGLRTRWYINGKCFNSQEKFEAARTSYYETHDIPVPGRQTKRANPN